MLIARIRELFEIQFVVLLLAPSTSATSTGWFVITISGFGLQIGLRNVLGIEFVGNLGGEWWW